MTVTVKVLIPAKQAENTQTTQYTGASNLIIDARTIVPDETYTCPELVGQALDVGGFISTLAGTATSLTIRASGREIS